VVRYRVTSVSQESSDYFFRTKLKVSERNLGMDKSRNYANFHSNKFYERISISEWVGVALVSSSGGPLFELPSGYQPYQANSL
jgi:hypothetical protein